MDRKEELLRKYIDEKFKFTINPDEVERLSKLLFGPFDSNGVINQITGWVHGYEAALGLTQTKPGKYVWGKH